MCTTTRHSFKDWLTETLDAGQIEDLAGHGADTGWPCLTYTSDCVELFERYEPEIREALNEDAEAFGYDSPEAFLATFNRSDMLWSEDGRKNLLVWFMAERVSREIVEGLERYSVRSAAILWWRPFSAAPLSQIRPPSAKRRLPLDAWQQTGRRRDGGCTEERSGGLPGGSPNKKGYPQGSSSSRHCGKPSSGRLKTRRPLRLPR